MTTALNELIQWINRVAKNNADANIFDIEIKAKELLEKEKKQIIDAIKYALDTCDEPLHGKSLQQYFDKYLNS